MLLKSSPFVKYDLRMFLNVAWLQLDRKLNKDGKLQKKKLKAYGFGRLPVDNKWWNRTAHSISLQIFQCSSAPKYRRATNIKFQITNLISNLFWTHKWGWIGLLEWYYHSNSYYNAMPVKPALRCNQIFTQASNFNKDLFSGERLLGTWVRNSRSHEFQ